MQKSTKTKSLTSVMAFRVTDKDKKRIDILTKSNKVTKSEFLRKIITNL